MQGMVRGVLSIQEILKSAILKNCQGRCIVEEKAYIRESDVSHPIPPPQLKRRDWKI